MNSIRKWIFRPKRSDNSHLAQFYYADEELNVIASELDGFDGRKEPARCTSLVNQLRHCQEVVLNIIEQIMAEAIPDRRAARDFHVKFPDDVLSENLAGQLWFGAECLAAGSSIMHREVESASMRPLALLVTKRLDQLRSLLREQCLKNHNTYTERICEALVKFDQVFAEFELSYVSAMVPVKTMKEFDLLQEVAVLFCETVQRALRLKLLTLETVESCDPALMFTIPRLAIICGLLIYPDGPLNPNVDPTAMSEMFRPFQTLLHKIRDLLYTLNKKELWQLEQTLCNSDESQYTPSFQRQVSLLSSLSQATCLSAILPSTSTSSISSSITNSSTSLDTSPTSISTASPRISPLNDYIVSRQYDSELYRNFRGTSTNENYMPTSSEDSTPIYVESTGLQGQSIRANAQPATLEDDLTPTNTQPGMLEDALATFNNVPTGIQCASATSNSVPTSLQSSSAPMNEQPTTFKDALTPTNTQPAKLEGALPTFSNLHPSLQSSSIPANAHPTTLEASTPTNAECILSEGNLTNLNNVPTNLQSLSVNERPLSSLGASLNSVPTSVQCSLVSENELPTNSLSVDPAFSNIQAASSAGLSVPTPVDLTSLASSVQSVPSTDEISALSSLILPAASDVLLASSRLQQDLSNDSSSAQYDCRNTKQLDNESSDSDANKFISDHSSSSQHHRSSSNQLDSDSDEESGNGDNNDIRAHCAMVHSDSTMTVVSRSASLELTHSEVEHKPLGYNAESNAAKTLGCAENVTEGVIITAGIPSEQQQQESATVAAVIVHSSKESGEVISKRGTVQSDIAQRANSVLSISKLECKTFDSFNSNNNVVEGVSITAVNLGEQPQQNAAEVESTMDPSNESGEQSSAKLCDTSSGSAFQPSGGFSKDSYRQLQHSMSWPQTDLAPQDCAIQCNAGMSTITEAVSLDCLEEGSSSDEGSRVGPRRVVRSIRTRARLGSSEFNFFLPCITNFGIALEMDSDNLKTDAMVSEENVEINNISADSTVVNSSSPVNVGNVSVNFNADILIESAENNYTSHLSTQKLDVNSNDSFIVNLPNSIEGEAAKDVADSSPPVVCDNSVPYETQSGAQCCSNNSTDDNFVSDNASGISDEGNYKVKYTESTTTSSNNTTSSDDTITSSSDTSDGGGHDDSSSNSSSENSPSFAKNIVEHVRSTINNHVSSIRGSSHREYSSVLGASSDESLPESFQSCDTQPLSATDGVGENRVTESSNYSQICANQTEEVRINETVGYSRDSHLSDSQKLNVKRSKQRDSSNNQTCYSRDAAINENQAASDNRPVCDILTADVATNVANDYESVSEKKLMTSTEDCEHVYEHCPITTNEGLENCESVSENLSATTKENCESVSEKQLTTTNEVKEACESVLERQPAMVDVVKDGESVSEERQRGQSGVLRLSQSGEYQRTLSVTSVKCEWDKEGKDSSSSDTGSYTSEPQDATEIALAIQAAEEASRQSARSQFKSSNDLIHRLFVCISGVADQLQTNYAADLRYILKVVFEYSSSLDENDIIPDAATRSYQRSINDINWPETEESAASETTVVEAGSAEGSEAEKTRRLSLGRTEITGTAGLSSEGAALKRSSAELLESGNDSESSSSNTGRSAEEGANSGADNRAINLSAPDWIPDDQIDKCMSCKVTFTLLRRRHHCRNCGKIFCARCSSNTVPLPQFGHINPVRVCNHCYIFHVTPFTIDDIPEALS